MKNGILLGLGCECSFDLALFFMFLLSVVVSSFDILC